MCKKETLKKLWKKYFYTIHSLQSYSQCKVRILTPIVNCDLMLKMVIDSEYSCLIASIFFFSSSIFFSALSPASIAAKRMDSRLDSNWKKSKWRKKMSLLIEILLILCWDYNASPIFFPHFPIQTVQKLTSYCSNAIFPFLVLNILDSFISRLILISSMRHTPCSYSIGNQKTQKQNNYLFDDSFHVWRLLFVQQISITIKKQWYFCTFSSNSLHSFCTISQSFIYTVI